MKATVNIFYSDTKPGTQGEIVKRWETPAGVEWVTLYFGRNLTGQKLKKSYPIDCLTINQ